MDEHQAVSQEQGLVKNNITLKSYPAIEVYKPLNVEKHEIRLLDILPGVRGEKIKCKLRKISLDEPGTFETLSYVWGTDISQETIILEDIEKSVTSNLFAALQALRRPNESRSIWIDALCICQSDVAERSSQVALMQQIYAIASQTTVYLHEGNRSDADTAEKLSLLATDLEVHWYDEQTSTSYIDPLSLYVYFRHAWYKRTWTAQELILSKSVIYQYGDVTFCENFMEKLLHSLEEHTSVRSCCPRAKIFDGQSKHMVVVYNLEDKLKELTELETLAAKNEKLPFLQVANLFRHRDASDPRDKVYGLLGLCNDLPTDLVNYDPSTKEVYRNLARSLIELTGSLDVLSHAIPNEDPPSKRRYSFQHESWFSWFPNWAANDRQSTILYARARLNCLSQFDACNGRRAELLESDPWDLRTRGVICGRIKAQSKRVQREIKHANQFHAWRVLAGIEQEPSRPYVAGGTIMNAFWRSVCGDVCGKPPQRATESSRLLHDLWWYDALKERYVSHGARIVRVDVIEFMETIQTAMAGKKFFISDEGYFGLCPVLAEEDDLIVVMPGGKVPYVMRPIIKSDTDEEDKELVCTFVGDCYVHGLMDGEAYTALEEGLRRERTLVLKGPQEPAAKKINAQDTSAEATLDGQSRALPVEAPAIEN